MNMLYISWAPQIQGKCYGQIFPFNKDVLKEWMAYIQMYSNKNNHMACNNTVESSDETGRQKDTAWCESGKCYGVAEYIQKSSDSEVGELELLHRKQT
jgi:hypothetical protein